MIQRCLLGRGKGINGQRETREGGDEGNRTYYIHICNCQRNLFNIFKLC